MAAHRRRSLPKIGRDTVITAVALGLTIFEAVIRSGPERPSLLALYAAMMGLPFVLRADEARRKKPDDEDKP